MRHVTLIFALWLTLAAWVEANAIQLTVEEPSGASRVGWPVTSGIPLAQGVLDDPSKAVLLDAEGQPMPLQTEALARWPDGSIRWLLLDFQVDLNAGQQKVFTLSIEPGQEPTPVVRPLIVTKRSPGGTNDRPSTIIIDTGPLRLEIPPDGGLPWGNVWLDANADGAFSADERVSGPDSSAIVLTDAEGRHYSASAAGSDRSRSVERIVVEQSGPLRACVRIEGHHVGERGRMFAYVARLHAFRGNPSVRLSYTFVNDHQDSLMARIRSLNLVFGLSGPDSAVRQCIFDGEKRSPEPLLLEQLDETQYHLSGIPAEREAAGWAAIGNGPAGFAVGAREFRQQWPKSIELMPGGGVRPGAIVMGICPEFPKGRYDGKPLEEENKFYYALRDGVHTFKVGLAKTHELWATFFAGEPETDELGGFFQAAEQPLLAVCEPAYVSVTQAAGRFPPADPEKYCGYDAWLDRALLAHLERRDRVREYGMLNYGDWYGERGVNWGNLEYDLAHGLFLQYLRTGDRRYFLRAEQAARHHIDVDTVHAVNPHLKNPWGDPPRIGEIWLHCLNHTGGYYDEAPLPVSRTYQMGHSTNFGHVWISGDLDYYYLTGDRRALDVSIQMADAMVHHMPTSYGTHIRALGWPMLLVLAAYDATGDPKYLEAAEKNWRVLRKEIDWDRGWVVRLAKGHCMHENGGCEGNVPFMEGLTLSALSRYHRVTGDPEVLRAITVGVDQMIRECWQEDVKTFRYTACPLSTKAPYVLLVLSAEAMAYEAALTGNQEHLRILGEGFRAAVPTGDGGEMGKGLAQMLFFAPLGLEAIESER